MFHTEIIDLDRAVDTDALKGVLAERELKRAARFLRDEDRRRFIVARAALRRVLGGLLGIPPERVTFAYGQYGKPFLTDTDLRFNLSHSYGRAMVAWTRGVEIGVDIEKVREVRFGVRIAHRYFNDDEREVFGEPETAEWEETFFRCWTRKEAFIKAVGEGMRHPLRSFSVPMGANVSGEPVRLHDGSTGRWRLSTVDAGEGYLAAVVMEQEGSRAS